MNGYSNNMFLVFLSEVCSYLFSFFILGLFFIGLPRYLMGEKDAWNNVVFVARYTILLPLTILKFIHDKLFPHISAGKILFALSVLIVNFIMILFVLAGSYGVDPNNILIFCGLVVIALGIYLTMIQDHHWKLDTKKAVLTFVITIMAGIAVNTFLEINLKTSLRQDLYERLHTTLIFLFWTFTDISMLFICLDTEKYFDFVKNIAKPDTLRNHAPSIARSVLCTVIASSVIYVFFGSITTTSVGGAVVGAISYVFFGSIAPRA